MTNVSSVEGSTEWQRERENNNKTFSNDSRGSRNVSDSIVLIWLLFQKSIQEKFPESENSFYLRFNYLVIRMAFEFWWTFNRILLETSLEYWSETLSLLGV